MPVVAVEITPVWWEEPEPEGLPAPPPLAKVMLVLPSPPAIVWLCPESVTVAVCVWLGNVESALPPVAFRA